MDCRERLWDNVELPAAPGESVAHGLEDIAYMLQDDQVWVTTRYVGHCWAAFWARG